MSEADQFPEPSTSGCLPILLRLFWLVLGHFALVILCFNSIIKNKSTEHMNHYFPAIVGKMVLARYLDIKFFKGTTASGTISTWGDFSKYTSILVGVAIAAWLLVSHIRA